MPDRSWITISFLPPLIFRYHLPLRLDGGGGRRGGRGRGRPMRQHYSYSSYWEQLSQSKKLTGWMNPDKSEMLLWWKFLLSIHYLSAFYCYLSYFRSILCLIIHINVVPKRFSTHKFCKSDNIFFSGILLILMCCRNYVGCILVIKTKICTQS